jgi:hypothetical protein
MNFNSPFFITYLENALFILYLPNYQLWMLLKNNGYFKNDKDDDDDDDDDGVSRTVDGYMHVESNATMLTLMNPIHGHDYHNINNSSCSSTTIGCDNLSDEIIDHHNDHQDDNYSHDNRGDDATRASSILRPSPSPSPLNKTSSSYTHGEVIYMAAYIAPFWFMANCLYYYSLEWTSVSSSTIIR